MAWSILISAIGLVLVFEGIMPFSSPHRWRQLMLQLVMRNDHFLRIMGFICMLAGLALVCVAHDLYSSV